MARTRSAASVSEAFMKGAGVTNEQLTPPEWMKADPVAVEEFGRVVDNFKEIGLLDNLDLTILAGYCNAYSHYIKCVEDTQKNGDVLIAHGKNGDTAYKNPAVMAADVYFKQMCSASLKMGLSSVDRLKLADLEKAKAKRNKFAALLRE